MLKQRFSENDPSLETDKNTLVKSFQEINLNHRGREEWEFWSRVVDNYLYIVENESETLYKYICKGMPPELRGMIWLTVSHSNNVELQQEYQTLKTQSSPFEKCITKDIGRTRFVVDADMKSRDVELFNVIKAYSIYDSEVGYTQGMAFLATPLLLNMNEEEAFSMLVKLMETYKFRNLYLPDMPGLHLKLYQFDRMIEDLCPELFSHLLSQGVKSSMYATQWFLTLFGYKFPLDIVLRIYDLVVAEGVEVLLKFSVNLMVKSQRALLALEFEPLLNYLKDELFNRYLLEAADGLLTLETYDLNSLVSDSMKVKMLPLTLKRYELEFAEVYKVDRERQEELEELRLKNNRLTRQMRKLEAQYTILNREHIELANEMIQGKVSVANLEEENKILRDQVQSLPLDIASTMNRNAEVMEANRVLEEQLSCCERECRSLRRKLYGEGKKWPF